MNFRPGQPILFFAAFLILLAQAPTLLAMETNDSSIFLFDFKLQDWGVQKIEDINRGQFALVQDPQKVYIELHAIYPSTFLEESVAPIAQNPSKPNGNLTIAFTTDHDVNNLGGRLSTYGRLPSDAQMQRTGEVIALDYKKEREGFCGLWMHLFDSTAPAENRSYLDSRPYQTLTFMIRGGQGGEGCSLRLADARWIEKEDSVFIGHVDSFLPSGRIDTEWTQVTVPLNKMPSEIKRESLGSLVFDIEKAGEGRIEVKEIRFEIEKATLVEKQSPPRPPSVRQEGKRPLQNAMWVWNTPELMKDSTAQSELIRTLSSLKINRVFLQNPEAFHQKDITKETLKTLRPFRSLVAALKKANVQTYALDGGRDYGQPENHDHVLATLSHIIQYNRQVSSDERLSGVHYDIESHALPGFGSSNRSQYLTNQLALYEKISARLTDTGLAFGVDMPFWYDSPDELSGYRNNVIFRGESKNISHHILDWVDYAVIMDYRTKAEDADGIVANAEGELQYASNIGKPVFIGVEVRPVMDQTLYRFKATPSRTVPTPFPQNGLWALRNQSGSVRSALFTTPESFQMRDRIFSGEGDSIFYIPFESPIPVSGDKISFASKTTADMQKVLTQAQSQLSQYSSFTGFAIHDYSNYIQFEKKQASDH